MTNKTRWGIDAGMKAKIALEALGGGGLKWTRAAGPLGSVF